MKNITLCAINARYTHSNLAVLCLKAAAKPGPDICIVEMSINDGISDIVNKIIDSKPDAVGFSCYIWNIEHVLKAASTVKKILPGCFVLLGGPEVSYDSKALLEKHSFIDMVIRGAGEVPFRYFAERFEEERCILDTPSSDIRDGNIILTTSDAPAFDLDSQPFFYKDLSIYENKIIYYETSRGCPYKCAYCMSANDQLSFLPLARVKRELEYFMKANVGQIKLVDRTFNYPPDRAYEIFKTNIGLSQKYSQSHTNFHFEISACLLDDRILDLLKTAPQNLIQLEIGIQSTNPQTLKVISRNHDLVRLLKNTKEVCSIGNIHVHVDLIAGLPHESYEIFAKSFNHAYSIGAHQLQLGFLKVLKGSPMQDMAEQYDIRYTDYPPYEVLSTHVMSYEELAMLHRIEHLVDTMYNTGHFKKTLEHLMPSFGSPFDFYEQLAHYMGKNEYFARPQKKQTLFEMVLRFAHEAYGVDAPVIREALVFDWLSLEKPRSWPKELEVIQTQDQKRLIRDLYMDKAWVAKHLPAYGDLSGAEIARRCYIAFLERLFGETTAVVFGYGADKPVIRQFDLIT